MKQAILLATCLALAINLMVLGQSTSDFPETREEMREWFREARFGMFIHWGIYSVLGEGEWVLHNKKMTLDDYRKLAPQFNPVQFDPAAWVSLARKAGMKYMTFTSKHHDGFAMWDSKVTEWDIVDATPYGRDIVAMLAEECHRQGIKLFLYHSHLDWSHPDYYPRGSTGQHTGRPDSGSFPKYLDFMNQQIAELAGGRYGKLGGFWFDGWWDQQLKNHPDGPKATKVDWKLEETYDLIHRLQPQALIGNNHHVRPFPGEDFQMFERDLPGENTAGWNADAEISELPLETADTLNKSWGYNRQDQDFKSTRELIHYLVNAAGRDSNFLLNVGPTPQGTIDSQSTERLLEMGRWLEENGESIYGTRGGPLEPQEWGVSTQRENRIYVHILEPQSETEFELPGVSAKRAFLLKDGKEVELQLQGSDATIVLDPKDLGAVNTIVVLE